MKYYMIDTTKGLTMVKTRKEIRNKEQARKIVGCGVHWIARCTPFIYYYQKVRLFFLKNK